MGIMIIIFLASMGLPLLLHRKKLLSVELIVLEGVLGIAIRYAYLPVPRKNRQYVKYHHEWRFTISVEMEGLIPFDQMQI